MAHSLDASTIGLVKATGPALRGHGMAIAEAMYETLLSIPDIRPMFDPARQGRGGAQPKALADALIAYAENIDNLPALAGAVESISHKHAAAHVKPEHYGAVAEALLSAIKHVLGEAASEPMLQAWGKAYWFLAEVLIGRETAIDEASRSSKGGWNGLRDFTLSRRIEESATITSFEFRPNDSQAILAQRPGQYLTLLVDVPGAGEQKRSYTISRAANDQSYRISVKREAQGIVSRWLHDTASQGAPVKIAPPSGIFVLPEAQQRPLVLVSGGVGLTPMVSMLEAIVARSPQIETHYVHSTADRSTHAFADHVRDLTKGRKNMFVTTFYSRAEETSDAGLPGRIDAAWLAVNTPILEADYYVCGPTPFMRAIIGGLVNRGVPQDRVHYEFFGAAEDLGTDEDRNEAAPHSSKSAPSEVGTAAPLPAGSAAVDPATVGEAILAAASDAVVVSDREGIITLWNPGAERIFGFSKEEALGQMLDIIVPEALRARHWEGYYQTVATGSSRYAAGDLLAVPGLTKSGAKISLEFTISMLKDGGKVSGMVAVLRDVTRHFQEMQDLRKRIAALEKK